VSQFMCERCWGDAHLRMSGGHKSQADHYLDLIAERKDNQCSPQEQAGQFWDKEKQRDTREGWKQMERKICDNYSWMIYSYMRDTRGL